MKKIALVHDFLSEYGGAERVLRVLADMYPQAPIYTAFVRRGSEAEKAFADRQIVESKWAWLIRRGNWHSPLRFLIPDIWRSFDLSDYEVVITSCSSYIARGFKVGKKTRVIAYCHTPPRWLYGYETSINWQRWWPVRWYGRVIGVWLRMFDWQSGRRVDEWLVNSENVRRRVRKFYRREAKVVYPPVELRGGRERVKRGKYALIVSRLVGGKGLVEAAQACRQLGVPLKIVGKRTGFGNLEKKLAELGAELVGFVSDEELGRLYRQAKVFLALAKDEDFGITVVEAMLMGTPVLAYRGGGFVETVKEGVTGVLVEGRDVGAIEAGLRKVARIKWDRRKMRQWAKKFSRKRFEREIKQVVEEGGVSGSGHSSQSGKRGSR